MDEQQADQLLSWVQPDALASEADHADLGDERLDERLGSMIEMMGRQPDVDFPEASEDANELQDAYRFIRNERTSFEKVAQPHFVGTAERVDAYQQGRVLAIHDTTHGDVADDRYIPGMGRGTSNSKCGFHLHPCVVVPQTGPRHVLGAAGAVLWRRELPTNMNTDAFTPEADCLQTLENESDKWERGVEQVNERVEATDKLIHVMDAGADDYSLLATLKQADSGFIGRVQQNRRVCETIEGIDAPKIDDCLERARKIGERTIQLSDRNNTDAPPSTASEHPSRRKREATVEMRATTVAIRRPDGADPSLAERIRVGLVWVREVDPPEGEEPVDWKLYTGEPVQTGEQVEHVVDAYRRRWVIEEYNGALKGGCKAVDRLLRSADTYTTTLGVLLPAAWRLLLMRSLAQSALRTSAKHVLRGSQLEALAAFESTEFDDIDGVTVAEAFEALALLGGHLERNGRPGWRVLMRGWLKMMPAEMAHVDTREKARERTLDEVRQKRRDLSPEAFEQWLDQQGSNG